MPTADAAAGSSSGQQQRAAANWLVTISSSYHDQLLARCCEMIAPAAREAGGGKPVAASHAGGGEVHVAGGGGRRSKSRLMVTRGQFIELLKGVPAMPQQMIEGWFDALALRFAHVPPPPAEFTLDFRRLLAAAGTALLPRLHLPPRAVCGNAFAFIGWCAAMPCRT